MKPRWDINPVWGAVLLAVALRAGVMVRSSGSFEDPDNYLQLARSLESGKGYSLAGRPTAYRPPLYPLMLAPLVKITGNRAWPGIAVLHLVLGAATVWLTASAARGWGLSPRRSLLAALIAAADPVLVWQSRAVMTETPSAFLVALVLAGTSRGQRMGAVLGGLALGLLALCRPSGLVPAAIAIAAAIVLPPGNWKERTLRAGLLAATTLLCLVPWIVRNTLVFGRPICTTTHGGYTLALANNPTYYHDVESGSADTVWTGSDQWRWFDAVNRATAGMTEPEADRYLQDSVIRVARNRPAEFGWAVVHRLRHFWSPAPSAAVYSRGMRWACLVWTVPLWLAFALGLTRPKLWRWPQIVAPLVCLGFTLIHAFYWTDMRMRAPLVPAIALVAASASISRSGRAFWRRAVLFGAPKGHPHTSPGQRPGDQESDESALP
jgi:4-amino-4-deoxy-L-arabinose transferase-like glycosyltransferase